MKRGQEVCVRSVLKRLHYLSPQRIACRACALDLDGERVGALFVVAC